MEVNIPSESCSVAFKEWAGVCDALIQGRQSLIVRKGGISEGSGPGVFVPEYSEFWLYPTWVHQAQQGLRTVGETVVPVVHQPGPGGTVPILALARVEWIGYIRSEAALPALEEFHILTDEAILKRFHYRAPGLWVLGTRIWRREPAFAMAPTPEQAGCKTWVALDSPLPTTGILPVLDERTWTQRLHRLRSIVDREDPGRRAHTP
jgi:hypothetical protein